MADVIAVIDGSRVVQFGSHDELIAQPGPYSELSAVQAAAYRCQSSAAAPSLPPSLSDLVR